VVALAAAGHLRVEALDREITPAVDQAADRIGRAVARELDRHRSYPRYRPFAARVTGPILFQRQGRAVRQETVV
jgi:hypothetical protein